MKNRLLLVVALIATTFLSTTAVAQDDYDFSVAAPSGQTLYYKISDSNNVTIISPGFSGRYDGCVWDYSPQTTGDLTIPDNVSYNGNSYAVSAIGEGAFYDCGGLTSVTIPNSVTSIGNYAFSGSALTSIVIPNSVTTIGHEAFGYCNSLTSVTISNSVTYIGSWAFYHCRGLTSITIPNSVISIRERAFAYCTGLTSVTIPASVTSIGESVFDHCVELTSIVVQDDNRNYDSRNNCNAIIETATNTLIAGCSSTIIPNTVTSIGKSAFYGFGGLRSVVIPNSVTSIGDFAFEECTWLSYVTIPNSVTSIGCGSFWRCYRLESITIPNSVTSIGNYAFYFCSGLTSVTIGNSVASIGDYAFDQCTGLTSITSLATTAPSPGTGAFSYVDATIPVKIPRRSILSYLSRWSYFSNFVALGSDGIDDAEAVEARIYQHNGQVVVEGAEGSKVTLYDAVGRLLSTKTDEYDLLRFDVPASGAYLIKIGRHAPRKVVVIK